jgi:hypothetical protein
VKFNRRQFLKSTAVVMGMPTVVPASVFPADPLGKECKLIINWDQQNMWALQLTYAHRGKTPDPVKVKAMLEAVVDEHAKAKIDRIVHCVFALPRGTVSPGFRSFHQEPTNRHKYYHDTETGIQQLADSGEDHIQVLLRRSHERGLEFLGGFRMNDRHTSSAGGPFARQHPEWELEGFPGAMDYKHEGVRRAVLEFTRELLERYNLDGIELDWMRHCHVFKPSTAVANAPILNSFLAELRSIIDQAGRKRGRRLILGARVPQTVEECRLLGFDINHWVKENLVDYLCPSDFFHTDFNIRMEDFTAITDGTRCKLYPSIHPWIARGNDFHVQSEASYRAAANNYYAFGADGISVYNYQYHWRTDIAPETEWPRVMSWLTGLRSAEAVRNGPRHYLFHPIWPSGAPTGGRNYDLIELSTPAPSGSLRFRVAERFWSDPWPATLEFKVTGLDAPDAIEVALNGAIGGHHETILKMDAPDAIEIALNGHVVSASLIQREFARTGQSPRQGRALPAFYRYRISVEEPLARFGDNDLRVRLFNSAGSADLTVQELELVVR